jgi:hypothetical protein
MTNLVENSFGLLLYTIDYWKQVADKDPRVLRKSDGQVMDFWAWIRQTDRHFWLKYKPDEIFGPGLLSVAGEKMYGSWEKAIEAINPGKVGATSSKRKSGSGSGSSSRPKAGRKRQTAAQRRQIRKR